MSTILAVYLQAQEEWISWQEWREHSQVRESFQISIGNHVTLTDPRLAQLPPAQAWAFF